jgi:hypothetical protein
MGGDADAAIDALRKVVTLEPAHEEAHAGLMRLFAGSGQRHLALRQYRQLRDAMRRDLDAEPDTSTQALHREILRSTAPLAAPADGQIVRSQRQLIGREDELAHLDECLSLLQQEQGGLVLVRGEGGIGKSRLVAEVMDRAGQLGITTLWDVPEASTDPDSSSFAAMLERLDNWSHASALRPRPTATATDFATISRANSTLLPSRDSTEAAPQRLSVAVDDFSWRPDVRSPVLIVIDDLHLASDVNPDLLYQLAEKGQYGPILFVGAFRPEEVLPGSSLDRLVRALEREAPERILEVNPLSFSHTESLVLELLGGPVDRAVVETVYELADGNPYFTQEATEALRGRGQISYSQGMWRLQAGPVMVWGREYLRQPDSRSKAASLTSYMRAS